jgi:transposase
LAPAPPTRHRDDPATQQWHLRRARRHADLSMVHALARQGYSQQAIARHTGRNRRTIRRWLHEAIPELSTETQEVAARVAMDGADAVLRRRTWTPERHARLQDLARQGLSHSAIARITGLHRVTVSRWLKTPVPDAAPAAPEPQAMAAEMADAGVADVTAALPPPAPWTSWAQVWQVREALKAHRWLFRRRPEHLTSEQQAQIDALVASPVGDQVGAARGFLLEWYALWRTDDGQRRSFAEAQDRYDRWRTNPTYAALPPLRKVQDVMSPARFTRLSQFLRQPHWEATNNGAERVGRAFRHRQAPHFRLRSIGAIDGTLRVVMQQTKEKTMTPATPILRLCPRGRRPRGARQLTRAA